jgi:SAM-dependent methyltransferase
MDQTPRRLTFGAHADAYERARPEWPAEAARWFVPEDARLVVELGAGTGKLTRAVSALGVRVVAVEPDERMRAVLESHGLDGVPGSAEDIPAGDGEADAVVAGSALHWFDLGRALPEIHRALRPGGRLAFGWNHHDVDDPLGRRLEDAIAAARTGSPGRRARDWHAAVTAGGFFGEVETARFPHVHEFPGDALDDHLLSYAGIAALPDDERGRLTATIREALGDSEPVRIPFVVEAYRAVRV